MLPRVAALFLVLLFAVSSTRGQEVFVDTLTKSAPKPAENKLESAWLDLRQIPAANSKPQASPDWVEAISTVPGQKTDGVPEKTVFRIRLTHPNAEAQVLFVRLFFQDN